MIVADILLIIITLAALIFAAITDLKIKEVPDWLSYGLIASGISIRLLHALIFNEFNYFLYGLLGLITMFIVGNILYHTKQWGGGDSKLLMGLGTTLATTPYYLDQSRIPFLAVIFVFILLSGIIYALLWFVFFIFRDTKRFKEEFNKVMRSKLSKIGIISSITLAIIFLILSIIFNSYTRLILIILTPLLIIYPFLFIAAKAIENLYLYTYLSPDKLMEGDWIVEDITQDKKTIFNKKVSITKKDIKTLKELNVKRVLVKDGIPFVPPFLIGTILALILGNPLI